MVQSPAEMPTLIPGLQILLGTPGQVLWGNPGRGNLEEVQSLRASASSTGGRPNATKLGAAVALFDFCEQVHDFLPLYGTEDK
jgi:hypothetical protein